MKKFIIGLVVGILLTSAGTAQAVLTLKEKGDWDDWWQLDRSGWRNEHGDFGNIRRIYDKENRLVCWIYYEAGISCQPSKLLEE